MGVRPVDTETEVSGELGNSMAPFFSRCSRNERIRSRSVVNVLLSSGVRVSCIIPSRGLVAVNVPPTVSGGGFSGTGSKRERSWACVMYTTFRAVPLRMSVSSTSPWRFILALKVSVGRPGASENWLWVMDVGSMGYVRSGVYRVWLRDAAYCMMILSWEMNADGFATCTRTQYTPSSPGTGSRDTPSSISCAFTSSTQ